MVRSNRTATLHALATLRREEAEQRLLDGLQQADKTINSLRHVVGHVDVSTMVALNAIEWVDDDLTVGQLRQALFNLHTRERVITPAEAWAAFTSPTTTQESH